MFLLPMNPMTVWNVPNRSTPPNAAVKDAVEISRIGSSTGNSDATNDGNSPSGVFAMLVNSASVTPAVSRSGTSQRRLIRLESCHPTSTGGMAASVPAITDHPRSTFNVSATASGPGCGATSVCVTAPAQQIAITNSV